MMSVLRFAVMISVLAALATPAAARIERGEFDHPIVRPSAEAEALRAVLDGAGEPEGAIETAVAASVRDFYSSRGYEPAWLDKQAKPAAATTALRALMDNAAEYGLDAALYATPALAGGHLLGEGAAEADVEFSFAVARFVTHAGSGRIQPSDISNLITLEPERADVAAALSQLSTSMQPEADLTGYEPPHPGYRALKGALAKLRAAPDDAERIVVPEGDLLKPGMSDARAPLIRERLAVALAADADPNIYDEALVAAVKAVQIDAGLNDDGIVGPRTLLALNGRSRADDIAAVVANLERWRWMPRDLGAFHIMVNVPEFMVRVKKDDAVVHETRVVVGKPANPTPTFSHVMSHVIVNPYWNVPASIVTKEMLPEIQANPYGYFARRGYQVFVRVRGKMRQVDPSWIDWYGINPRVIQIRQVPGDDNALGRIKFMFPNQHSVYLHDTPSKSLFQRDERALSHGCVRVDKPLDFADAILPVAAPEWDSTRLENLYGGKERRVSFDTPIPVHLAYFTASVDADGTLRTFADIYGYDSEMTAFLGT